MLRRIWLWRWWPVAIWTVALLAYGHNMLAGYVPAGIWSLWLAFGGIEIGLLGAVQWRGRQRMPAEEYQRRAGEMWIFGVAMGSLAVVSLVIDALRGVWW